TASTAADPGLTARPRRLCGPYSAPARASAAPRGTPASASQPCSGSRARSRRDMASVEVDLIRHLARVLRRTWLVYGTGDAFSTGKGSSDAEDVRAALEAAQEYFRLNGIPEDEEDDPAR